MGVQVTIDVKQRLVVSTFSGEVNDAEIWALASLIRSSPDFDPSFSDIMDMSGVSALTMPIFTMKEFSKHESIFNPASTHVVIAPQDHIFGLARMGQVYAERTKPNVVVVRTMEEARKTLGLGKTD